jgi:putative sterol carrier protein
MPWVATGADPVSHADSQIAQTRPKMALRALQNHLQDTFFPPAAEGLDAVLCLAIGDDKLIFEVSSAGLAFDEAERLVPDATFFFEDVDIAWALLSGRADAFSAFMEGRFRADGHLMWAFSLMAMFQSQSLPETPIE